MKLFSHTFAGPVVVLGAYLFLGLSEYLWLSPVVDLHPAKLVWKPYGTLTFMACGVVGSALFYWAYGSFDRGYIGAGFLIGLPFGFFGVSDTIGSDDPILVAGLCDGFLVVVVAVVAYLKYWVRPARDAHALQKSIEKQRAA